MNLEKLVVVNGIPGIHKMAANRNNGLIIEDLDTGKRRFTPSRKYQFTPLESITIYLEEDENLELSKVFDAMFSKVEELPIVSVDAPNDEIRSYFSSLVPNHDKEKVHLGDMKKIIKWYNFLNDRSLISLSDEPVVKDEVEEENS